MFGSNLEVFLLLFLLVVPVFDYKLIYVVNAVNKTFLGKSIFEPQREKTYLLICGPNVDSNQPAHRVHSQIRIYTVRMKKLHPWLSKL